MVATASRIPGRGRAQGGRKELGRKGGVQHHDAADAQEDQGESRYDSGCCGAVVEEGDGDGKKQGHEDRHGSAAVAIRESAREHVAEWRGDATDGHQQPHACGRVAEAVLQVLGNEHAARLQNESDRGDDPDQGRESPPVAQRDVAQWLPGRCARRARLAAAVVIGEAPRLLQGAPEPRHAEQAEAADDEEKPPPVGHLVDEGVREDRQCASQASDRRQQPEAAAAILRRELFADHDRGEQDLAAEEAARRQLQTGPATARSVRRPSPGCRVHTPLPRG